MSKFVPFLHDLKDLLARYDASLEVVSNTLYVKLETSIHAPYCSFRCPRLWLPREDITEALLQDILYNSLKKDDRQQNET